jgi:hypothetical protein
VADINFYLDKGGREAYNMNDIYAIYVLIILIIVGG